MKDTFEIWQKYDQDNSKWHYVTVCDDAAAAEKYILDRSTRFCAGEVIIYRVRREAIKVVTVSTKLSIRNL